MIKLLKEVLKSVLMITFTVIFGISVLMFGAWLQTL